MKRLFAGVLFVLLAMHSVFIPTCKVAEAVSQELYFTILHTNDEHSALLPSPLVDYHPELPDPARGGFARLAQAVSDIRETKTASGEPVLLVSAGDYLGGSPFAWLALSGQAVELSLMIELGYDVVTIGNHEYDYGSDLLAEYLQRAGYPEANQRTALVSSNTLPPAGHPLGEVGIKSTHMEILSNGLKVGFFGILGAEAVEYAPFSKPVEFGDQVASARRAVESLRQQGANVIVAVNHAGLDEDEALARAVPGIHIIVSAHCHTELDQPRIVNGTIIVQSGELLRNLGVLELVYDPSSGQVRTRNSETGRPHLLPLDDRIPIHAVFAEKVDEVRHQLDHLIQELSDGRFQSVFDTVIMSDFSVSNGPKFQETPFGNFVVDAMRFAGEQALGERVDFAIQGNGVIRGSITPGSAPHSAGKVALLDLLDLVGLGSGPDKQPGYPLVSVYFTGQEMRRILEVAVLLSELMGDSYYLQFSGLRMTYDPARAIIGKIPFKGTPIPSTRAVLSAERYTGDVLQGFASYEPLQRNDQTLYHVISDYYLVAFLPMVGEMLPSLSLVMKDRNGNPISVDEAIVYRNGQELKVWQAVVEYAASQPKGSDSLPRMPEYYRTTAGRLTIKNSVPLLVYPAGLTLLLVALITYVIVRRRRHRLNRPA
jgi:UDP-sugar diphosphatase